MESMLSPVADMASPSGSTGDLVLVMRPPAYGLPTACPACLSAFLYLRLGAVSFQEYITAVEPDSEDLPSVEYGERVGYASENGGVVEFLRRESVLDLDEGLNESERAELETCKAMMESWVADASACELWTRENDRQCKEVYYSQLPWGLVQALDWRQRAAVMQRLGVTPENAAARSEELFRKGANAYSALSVLLGDNNFFFETRPTSLDAIVLGHLLFHMNVPFEISTLKGEIMKHENLVKYAESWSKQLLHGELDDAPAFRPKAPPPPPRPTAAAPAKEREKPAKKPRSEKDLLFRKRAKYFVIAQFVAVVMYVVFAGFEVEGDDDVGDDDE